MICPICNKKMNEEMTYFECNICKIDYDLKWNKFALWEEYEGRMLFPKTFGYDSPGYSEKQIIKLFKMKSFM